MHSEFFIVSLALFSLAFLKKSFSDGQNNIPKNISPVLETYMWLVSYRRVERDRISLCSFPLKIVASSDGVGRFRVMIKNVS